MSTLPISQRVAGDMTSASWVRAMFEVGLKLKAELGEENVFDFSLGNPNASPPAEFFAALERCAGRREPARHRYMSNAGFPETRAAVAAFLAREYGVPFRAEMVLATCGAAAAMNVIMRAILNPGDEVIVLAPYFSEYRFYVEHAQGRLVVVDTDRAFQPDAAAIEAALTERTRAVVVNSPNNPTGAVYGEEACRRLGEMLRRHDGPDRPIYLVCDDIYRRVVYGAERCPAPARHHARSIVASSFSKDISIPGERIGYAAVHPELPQRELLMSAMIMLNRTMGFVNAPALMQRVVVECIDACCDVNFYRRNRDRLCGALRSFGYEIAVPGGAFYAFPRSPIDDDVRFVEILQRHRVLAVPGRGFGRPGYIRLSYAVSPEVVERSLPHFQAAWEEARGGG